MAKKKSIKTKKKKVPVVSKERQFLMTLIKFTERYIKNDGTELDLVFKQQADKLKKQLEETK
jgi:hypothetical protein